MVRFAAHPYVRNAGRTWRKEPMKNLVRTFGLVAGLATLVPAAVLAQAQEATKLLSLPETPSG